jgi:hypothetical protein
MPAYLVDTNYFIEDTVCEFDIVFIIYLSWTMVSLNLVYQLILTRGVEI